MKMNYNKWFYSYHKYLKGEDNEYLDTKWKNINQRMKTLIDLNSDIINEQSFGVISNYTGFDKLIDLLDKSDYTFQDLNKALIDTYKMSFENAMSRMCVNTHTVITHCNINKNKKFVSVDPRDSKYYIIDVPFNQFHFGPRDEMIRRFIREVYSRQNDYYMPMDRFINEEITKTLDFTILCTGNGMIINDWGVAIDDKGFHFRIGWGRSYDVDFIIYKLDSCCVKRYDVSMYDIENSLIHNIDIPLGTRCILNIFDSKREKYSMSVPNFGVMTEDGLKINGLQQRTVDDIKKFNNYNVSVIIYGFKFIHELPNVYPAVNFCNMQYLSDVYTEDGNDIVPTGTNKNIIGRRTESDIRLPICTPPISVDRSADTTFKTVLQSIHMKEDMYRYESMFVNIGTVINSNQSTTDYFINKEIIEPSKQLLDIMKEYFKRYLSAGITTSMISYKNEYKFKDFINRLQTFVDNVIDIPSARSFSIDEFYGDNFVRFVDDITKPFDHKGLTTFRNYPSEVFTQTYFDIDVKEKNTRFNRPISENCFIALKYSEDEQAWVFACPNIKHFHGIGNTFYINDELNGDEVFKFFILYSDTEDPMEKNIEPFDFETVFDFDKFSMEVEKHIAYIRYWNVENHLHKITDILYNDKESTDKQIQVLSKILLRKLNGEELLDLYPTDMNYEPSNATTDNILKYDEYSDRAPFTLNFLFYTINMLYDNKDQMLSYFIGKLTQQNYARRYEDIDISKSYEHKNKVNYSIISNGPVNVSLENPDGLSIVYGVPNVFNNGAGIVTSQYQYIFNNYSSDDELPTVTDTCGLDYESYGNATIVDQYCWKNDCKFAKLIFSMIGYCDDCLSEIQTDYVHSYDITNKLDLMINSIGEYVNKIKYMLDHDSFMSSRINNEKQDIITKLNDIHDTFSSLSQTINDFRNSIPGNKNVYDYINDYFLKELQDKYRNVGFEEFARRRIDALYYHFIKINKPMNLFKFTEWINGIDLHALKYLDDVFTTTGSTPGIFIQYYDKIKTFVDNSMTFVNDIQSLYSYIQSNVRDVDIAYLSSIAKYIITNSSFDMYTIDKVNINVNTVTFNTKPRYIVVNASITDFNESTSNKNLIFVTHSESVSGGYKIKEIIPICEYALFDDSDIVPNSITVYDSSRNTLSSSGLTITISPVKVSNASDTLSDIEIIPDIIHSEYVFDNVHESTITVGDMCVGIKTANMNYELYAGNNFEPLDHEQEIVLNRQTMIEGPIDTVNISNAKINSYLRKDYGTHESVKYSFKPVQVVHATIDTTIDPIGKGYHVGQTVYVKTNDSYEFTFPIIITAIDHNKTKGFIEAIVDYNKCEWLKVNDSDVQSYLMNPITCTIIDDNMSNFLDEFNKEYSSYNIPSRRGIHESETVYTLPGDPIYVQEHPNYVYTRLSWLFDTNLNNLDESDKRRNFVYINYGSILQNGSMTLNLINHDFNQQTLPEIYPILRQEPNDHEVYNKEHETFIKLYNDNKQFVDIYKHDYEYYRELYFITTQSDEKLKYQLKMEDAELKWHYYEAYIKRLENYINQPENPTTWYNVYAYDDAITYIDNGRANITHNIPRFNIADVTYSEKIGIRLYDWEHKTWLNHNDFEFIITQIDSSIDETTYEDYRSNNVQYSITITPKDNTFSSRKILVYFTYVLSDVFDTVEPVTNEVDVYFKPIVSTYVNTDDNVYSNIFIRKHFDTNEIYNIDETYSNDDFSLDTGYYVKRVARSGKYPYSSIVRWEDLTFKNSTYTYGYEDFDIYERFPFNKVDYDQIKKDVNYQVNINQPIDGFTDNETITLICISSSQYTGNISPLLFTATTSTVNSEQTLTIIEDSIHDLNLVGEFVCSVAKHPSYKSSGGVVTVTIEVAENEIITDANHRWYKVLNPQHRIISDEFILVPKEETILVSNNVKIELHNNYNKNTNTLSPYTYYYDITHNVRYPISDIRRNKIDSRLVITDANVKQVKSNFIGLCRYSLQKIPKNGFIDVTGYIPTPLSRDRYEFWVNGRCITNTDNLIILSPTSFQLVNLKSLHNFELIELVDDNYRTSSSIFPTGSVYMDLDGHAYSSYTLALLSNHNHLIKYQDIEYRFFWNERIKLDSYSGSIVNNPNNVDVETDILSYISDSVISSYNELFNIPTINGVSIYHPTITDLGILEIPDNKILSTYDRVWRYEIAMNPLFPMTHRDLVSKTQYVRLKVDPTLNGFKINTVGMCNEFFTLYISTTRDGDIKDTSTTVKIIPMIRLGTGVIIDKSYRGMWLQCTFNGTKPIQIN